jgi:hypothetical protein
MKSNDFVSLVQDFEADNGSANFGFVVIHTDPYDKYYKKVGDLKFPYAKGELVNIKSFTTNFGVRYSDKMERLNGEYEAGKVWHVPYKFANGKYAKNLVQHVNGGMYLKTMPEMSSIVSKVYDKNGNDVTAQLKPFKKPVEYKEGQVICITTKAENVKFVKMRGKEYRF